MIDRQTDGWIDRQTDTQVDLCHTYTHIYIYIYLHALCVCLAEILKLSGKNYKEKVDIMPYQMGIFIKQMKILEIKQ